MNQTVVNLLSHGVAPATKAAYKHAYHNFLNFHARYYLLEKVFPIQPLQIAQFIVFSLKQGLKGSSIQAQVAGINYMHRMMGYPSITDNFIVKKILTAAQKVTQSHDKRLPITVTILKSLINSLAFVISSPYDRILYNAMFLTAFFALLRVGEFTATQFGSANIIQYHNLELGTNNQGLLHVIINMQQHKHSKWGIPLPITLTRQNDTTICPVLALTKYLRIRGSIPGPLFITADGLPITSNQFAATLRECITCLGLDPSKYTTHAFRIGGACHAHQNNFSDTQLKRLGRWKSSAYTKYIRCPTVAPNILI